MPTATPAAGAGPASRMAHAFLLGNTLGASRLLTGPNPRPGGYGTSFANARLSQPAGIGRVGGYLLTAGGRPYRLRTEDADGLATRPSRGNKRAPQHQKWLPQR